MASATYLERTPTIHEERRPLHDHRYPRSLREVVGSTGGPHRDGLTAYLIGVRVLLTTQLRYSSPQIAKSA